MIAKVGDYVFGFDESESKLLCFKNRRVRFAVTLEDEPSRVEMIEFGKKIIAIIENVPDEYYRLLDCVDLEDG